MIEELIEKLLTYARVHLDMNEEDVLYFRNLLMLKLKVHEPFAGKVTSEEVASHETVDFILLDLRKYIIESKLVEEKDADAFLVEIMGMMTPLPSQVTSKFNRLYKESPVKATDYFYRLSIRNDYIKKTAVDANIKWVAKFPENFLEITINLSKPEKSNKDIARLVNSIPSGYPKCVLCKENLGFAGRPDSPARENIRLIPLNLAGERWYLQYSPYVYYDEHCIVLDERHVPMAINKGIFEKLFAFVDLFPHYFVGSNSDLPIVGGSILNHEHFQGGRHLMPIMAAKTKFRIASDRFHEVEISYLDWYNTCFLLKSLNKEQLLSAASHLSEKWRKYDDKEASIIANDGTQHSTLTPIARKVGEIYYLYLILRNNRCDEKYPEGIFHAHPEYHNIKHEGIGLIEAMGLFILPARLERQISEILEIVTEHLDPEAVYKTHPDLLIHRALITELLSLKPKDPKAALTEMVNKTCRSVLENTGVYKNTPEGYGHLTRFIKSLNL
ncbi:MAG: UDP-glucose--hexose-1-phosphate uridylyltransferase [Firmicutes bacterium]|nr:UDP-glucose--hexose-1-phosphate uridylyltransferase [Bacillota bacterium]